MASSSVLFAALPPSQRNISLIAPTLADRQGAAGCHQRANIRFCKMCKSCLTLKQRVSLKPKQSISCLR